MTDRCIPLVALLTFLLAGLAGCGGAVVSGEPADDEPAYGDLDPLAFSSPCAPASAPAIELSVQGAPRLPLDGTRTPVTVDFVHGTPVRVAMSRDGFPAFAVWPDDDFFTLAADGRSLAGSWCISRTCWGDVDGGHVLDVVATYDDGSSASASVDIAVVDESTPSEPPPSGMWAEVDAQRVAFADPNDCHARVDAVPTSGGVTLQPGQDINAALAANSVVFLSGGTYVTPRRIVVPRGKKLVGVAGQSVVIAAGNDTYGVIVSNDSTLANVTVDGSGGDGVTFYDQGANSGSTGALLYRVVAIRSGYYNLDGTGAAGIRLTQNAANNCVVSSEAIDSWNYLGAPNDHGGNSDGMVNSFGAHHNTFIDVRSYRNGDDGFDMWQGGATYWYFGSAFDNGKTTGMAVTGDGNGIKLGVGDVQHKFYKTTAVNNVTCGWNLNGNAQNPLLVQCGASGNGGGGDYCYFTH